MIFNLKVCRIKPFISGFGPNPIEHRAKTGRLHCLLHSFSCAMYVFFAINLRLLVISLNIFPDIAQSNLDEPPIKSDQLRQLRFLTMKNEHFVFCV